MSLMMLQNWSHGGPRSSKGLMTGARPLTTDPIENTAGTTADVIHTCNVCLKPEWRRGNNPKQSYCRDHCVHSMIASCCDPHQDAPTLKTEPGPMPENQCSPLLPPEVAEILQASTKPLSRKKVKKLEQGAYTKRRNSSACRDGQSRCKFSPTNFNVANQTSWPP